MTSTTPPPAVGLAPAAERYSRAGYLGSLNREWMRDLADRPDPLRWAHEHPCLSECRTLQTLLDEITAAPAARRDELLIALLTLAHDGDQIAGRTVMQTMLPTVQWLASVATGRALDDAISHAVEAMWLTIRTYPLHRRQRVAANLKLDALKAVAHGRSPEVPSGSLLELDGVLPQQATRGHQPFLEGTSAHPDPDDIATQPLGGASIDDAAQVLVWAASRGIISEAEQRLLTLTHLGPRPLSCAQAAVALDVSPAAVRQRHSRAVRKLATAVRAAMQQ